MLRRTTIILALLVLVGRTARADDWPAFRGPAGNGISQETDFPVTWSRDENVKWRAELPGPGNSSPIVAHGRVFVTCAEDQGRKRSLYCYDRDSGSRLWVRTVSFDKVMPTHKTSPYCGSTPAAGRDRVVVWHSSAGLYCYDLDGRQLWSCDLGEFRHMWGYGSSPVLYENRVVLNCGPGKRVFLAAVDLDTGKTIWETEEPFEGDGNRNENKKYIGSWSTPAIANAGGRDLIICAMPTRLNAYDPETGAIVWSCDGLRGRKGDLVYTSPILAGDVCVAMGGFNGPAIGVSMDGSGNVTGSHRLWRVEPNPQRIGSGVCVDGHVYMASAGPSTFQCLSPKTGEILWEEDSEGAVHWGSLVFAGGRLYVTDQAGTTHVFLPNPEKLELMAHNPLGERSNSTPAFSDGEIFIRTFEHLYCIGR